ncbi:MAG: hypothetical protein F4202_03330 [Cenarchaeum sp. SB0677_bin_16]|nr:hypothetical protein [Cenarchaeum sp. SB0677_bin_16]
MSVFKMFIVMIAGLLLPHTEPTKEDAPEKVENTEPAGTIHEETAEVAVGEQVEQDRSAEESAAKEEKAAKKSKKKPRR